jgi:hypothetical protein
MSGGGIRQDAATIIPIAADAVSGRDPTGDVCERRKGEGFIAWGKRCAQDCGAPMGIAGCQFLKLTTALKVAGLAGQDART